MFTFIEFLFWWWVFRQYPKWWKWVRMKAFNRYFFVLVVLKGVYFIISPQDKGELVFVLMRNFVNQLIWRSSVSFIVIMNFQTLMHLHRSCGSVGICILIRLPMFCSSDNYTLSSWCGWHTDHGSLTGERLVCSSNSVLFTSLEPGFLVCYFHEKWLSIPLSLNNSVCQVISHEIRMLLLSWWD